MPHDDPLRATALHRARDPAFGIGQQPHQRMPRSELDDPADRPAPGHDRQIQSQPVLASAVDHDHFGVAAQVRGHDRRADRQRHELLAHLEQLPQSRVLIGRVARDAQLGAQPLDLRLQIAVARVGSQQVVGAADQTRDAATDRAGDRDDGRRGPRHPPPQERGSLRAAHAAGHEHQLSEQQHDQQDRVRSSRAHHGHPATILRHPQ